MLAQKVPKREVELVKRVSNGVLNGPLPGEIAIPIVRFVRHFGPLPVLIRSIVVIVNEEL
jgi:hypothetical protein